MERTLSYEEPERKKLKLTSENGENESGPQTSDGTEEYEMDDLGLTLSNGEAATLENDSSNLNMKESNGDINETHSKRENGLHHADNSEDFCLNKTDVPSIKKIVSVQRDALSITKIIPDLDFEQLYQKILQNRKMKNRVDLVTNEILEKLDNGDSESNVHDDLNESVFQDVANILEKHPNLDPSRVYDLLEKLQKDSNRVKKVVKLLTGKDYEDSSIKSDKQRKSTQSESVETSASLIAGVEKNNLFSDPDFKKNPLYKDMKTLVKVLPERDQNEIYAYLEAHFDKPNRVQIVIDELTKSDSQESLPGAVESFEDGDRGKAPQTAEDKLYADLNELKEIFRDCDPSYLHECLVLMPDDQERVHKIATKLFEKKDYPKLKDTLGTKSKVDDKERITSMVFDLKVFLSKFPEPVAYFESTERLMSQNYMDHAQVYMKNTYPQLKAGFITKILKEANFHLVPAVKAVEDYLATRAVGPSKNKVRRTLRDKHLDYPENPDEPFFQEVLYYQHMNTIKDHLEEKKRVHEMKVEVARDCDELMECGCCFDDECLFEDMRACGDGHLFCNECIRRSVEAAVGDGRANFLCLTGTCEQVFPVRVLQDVLTAPLFSLALRKIQEEELRLADIPDLVSCPFCTFATIMPDENNKVFACLNPECLRESCRLCKEPNHVPLRCEEVEKGGVTSLRTYIETKVSESMLRQCPKCNKRFFKVQGCNKMTCVCGTSMCYLCREPNIDYDHFNDGGCSIDTDVNNVHQKEMMDAAVKAKEEYLTKHPEIDPDQLNLDLEKLINSIVTTDNNGGGDDDDDYHDDDDPDEY